ncbi:MAG: indolepyruvate ferredoxin oxidoreductase family protein [Burkholderiales bacterium]|nr:indolepyruvate ferredoxin oxidoreductase family protein [Burkholderiales bacterium]
MAPVTLDDKYRLERGRVFVTGVQALARLPMLQAARDHAGGLKTAGYVTGYRGSPLGGLDFALHDARSHLAAHGVEFLPAVNEELGATAVWGTQQLHLLPGARRDGIFALWYAKGPGVDRCADVFKHANYAGTSEHGGVLLVAGDDHSARSSAVAHQSEHSFAACGIPVLAPADLQECLDLGLHGWAMSRYSGCWVAMKTTADIVESSATVEVDPARVQIRLPEDFKLPPGGVHIRWPDPQLAQERRMAEFKVYAAVAYARANGLNRLVWDSPRPRLGIIACGKAWLDVRQALHALGIDERVAADIGLRLFKVGMVWPLEADGVRHFAQGLEEILVVEEKRQIIEYQLKEMLYQWRDDVRPRVVGKFDESGEWPAPPHQWLLPPTGELTPALAARAIASRLARFHTSEAIASHLAFLDAQARQPPGALTRMPWFCSGCPHSRSTRVPEGSSALGGVGCHLMATWMERSTLTICQMGGEGATWLGMAAHAGVQHVFANMGDGTYYHSGLLAIRAAIAAGVNITYKLLYNDAVAMTGGQPVDGPLTVPRITRQLEAEGVARIVLLADAGNAYEGLAPGVERRPREDIDAVQRELREIAGVTVLVFDQVCATELRRRRKRGKAPAPKRHVFINEMVCEGCGDCSVKSNCLSVVQVETEYGRKYMIDQASCNVDEACLAGLCPSLVTVEGGAPRKKAALALADAGLPVPPEPVLPALDARGAPFNLLVAGIGGTGVVTIGALLGMAAHLDGRGVTVLDVTGLAQKGGSVLSHLRIAATQDRLDAPRLAPGAADLMLGCDALVAAGPDALSKVRRSTRVLLEGGAAITGDVVRHPDHALPLAPAVAAVKASADAVEMVDATRLAARLLGQPIAANLFLLGVAWQRGLVPLTREALARAIELNGVAAADNLLAFEWGRRWAADPEAVERAAQGRERTSESRRMSRNLDETIERRRAFLVEYQDERLAARYAELVARVQAAEQRVAPGSTRLADAVARGWFKLLSPKDEYEVARLFSHPDFAAALADGFEGEQRVHVHLAIPILAPIDPVTGEPRKRAYGPWMLVAMRALARLKGLRGTPLDPFRHGAERRLDRELRDEYEAMVPTLLAALRADNLGLAVDLAALPDRIRGYGPVRLRNAEAARRRQAELMAQFARAPLVKQAQPADA